jgi:hypothetical protein
VNHLFYAEDIQKFQLRLCPFIDIKRKFFRTTLLNPYKLDPVVYSPKLTTALTIRCASWNEPKNSYIPFKVGNIVPATKDPSLASASKSRYYTNFEYREKGGPENNPLRHLRDDEESPTQSNDVRSEIGAGLVPGTAEYNKQLRIGAWAQQIGDIFGEVPGPSGHPSSHISAFESNPAVGKLSQHL